MDAETASPFSIGLRALYVLVFVAKAPYMTTKEVKNRDFTPI